MLQCFTCQRQSIYFKLKIIHTSETVIHRYGMRCSVLWYTGYVPEFWKKAVRKYQDARCHVQVEINPHRHRSENL
jgi:hypothetical protein